ncbi:hypothetical protein EPA93_39015 [Ktedonosporobacter rubrisoli]|uniref:DUF4350 domain-containing protein n=1 Tax=Ktedonosporobacter rubrisoli TaxID=2509675 RepID=A0A4P6K0S1_KTERU|nr:hypothetical protein [Ktedonosporobacter rubrisoli]QBD81644.1 hypothetical protein EPA93_39015 [Ktedonosporobacter rubrisoli]
MPGNKLASHHISTFGKILARPGLILVILFTTSFMFGASAQASAPSSANITLQMTAGFNAITRVGYWLPVQILLKNHENHAFSGTLSLQTFTGLLGPLMPSVVSPQRFEETIALSPGEEKHISLTLPFNVDPFNPRGVMAHLLDEHGKVLATQAQNVRTLSSGDVFVGLLSDRSTGLSALNAVMLPGQLNTVVTTPLDANTLPSMSTILQNFDVIVLDDFTTSELKPAQILALQTWVNQGGVLVEVGGPEWQRTLSGLPPDLLPVIGRATWDIPAGTHLLPPGSITVPSAGQQPGADAVSEPIPVSLASTRSPGEKGQGSPSASETVMAVGSIPLLVQARQGQGTLCYLAFDPARPPLANWQGASTLWQHLLQRTLGDQLLISTMAPKYTSGPGGLLARGGILRALQPDLWFATLILVCLLFGYIVLLGPVRILLIRRLKLNYAYWNWRIVVSSIIICSLLTYGIASYQKGAALVNNSFSIMQLNQSGSAAHITTYLGVFVPNQGDFKVQFPSAHLPQPVSSPLLAAASMQTELNPSTPITYQSHETDVNLLNSGLWTFHPLVSEQDRHLHGAITTHLALQDQRLIGTISNTLATSLSDVYILIPHNVISIGHLPAGATQRLNIPLPSISTQANPLLANQIASHNGLPANYYPYTDGNQPRTEAQRHVALLSALNGAGFSFYPCNGSCTTNAILNLNKSLIITPRPGAPNVGLENGNDPLLLNGSPATLLGWADQPLDEVNNVTINGGNPRGFHENLIQMPLNIDITSTQHIPPDLISGRVVDVQGTQGNNVEMIQPGIYTMITGDLNFEFDLSNVIGPALHGLSITVPNTLDHLTPRMVSSHVQASLYNWQTGNWDTFPLLRYTLTTSDIGSYLNADGHVLLQITNQKAPQGTVILSRPSLNPIS